jgi:hypothetical protein
MLSIRSYFQRTNNRGVPTEAVAPRLLTAGRDQCPYCRGYFAPQGMPAHIRMHVSNHDRPRVRQREDDGEEGVGGGRVKLRVQNSDGTFTTLTAAESARLLRHERGQREQEGVINIDGSEEEDNNETMEEDESGAAEEGEKSDEESEENDDGGGGGDDNEEDDEEDDDDGEEVEDGEDNEEDVDDEGGRQRGKNWTPKEKAAVLKEYEETTFGKNEFCRYIRNKYNRNFQRQGQLNVWLADKERIMADASKDKSDRRHQISREKTGKYPEMEILLDKRIRGMREMGYVVETWMVDFEARAILHELYPSRFPPPSEDGSGDEEHPFKAR